LDFLMSSLFQVPLPVGTHSNECNDREKNAGVKRKAGSLFHIFRLDIPEGGGGYLYGTLTISFNRKRSPYGCNAYPRHLQNPSADS
jgi:hypothetical protein